MTVKIAFRVNEVVEAGDRLRAAADAYDQTLAEMFAGWVETVAEAMREEIPKDTWETADSVEVRFDGPTSATVGPTNRDGKGRPVGFFINYGTGRQPPDDFIGRTATRARDALDNLNVGAVL